MRLHWRAPQRHHGGPRTMFAWRPVGRAQVARGTPRAQVGADVCHLQKTQVSGGTVAGAASLRGQDGRARGSSREHSARSARARTLSSRGFGDGIASPPASGTCAVSRRGGRLLAPRWPGRPARRRVRHAPGACRLVALFEARSSCRSIASAVLRCACFFSFSFPSPSCLKQKSSSRGLRIGQLMDVRL